MAFFTMKLKSSALQSTTTVRLYLPCDHKTLGNQPPKGMLTLLHGYTNDGDDWVNYSAALRYAADNGLALLIPDGCNSFFHDMAAGQGYYSWLTEELPSLLKQMVLLPWEREKNAICGLSMGGYGALMVALNHPERYFACGSFSGALNLRLMLGAAKAIPEVSSVFSPILGQELLLTENRDLFQLATSISQLPKEQQPDIFCTVGKQDIEPYQIYYQNQTFQQHAKHLGLKFSYMEWDGGHEWSFWDKSLVYAIDKFFAPGYANTKLKEWAAK